MKKRWMRWIWDSYEALFARLLGLQPVAPGSLLLFRRTTYRGRPLYAGDQVLMPGSRVLDIHLNNRRLVEPGQSALAVAWRVRACIEEDLLPLYQLMQAPGQPAAAVVGTSILSTGIRDLGFHVDELPAGPVQWWFGIYMRWLERIYRPAAKGHRRRPRRRRAAVCWLTRTDLELLVHSGPRVRTERTRLRSVPEPS